VGLAYQAIPHDDTAAETGLEGIRVYRWPGSAFPLLDAATQKWGLALIGFAVIRQTMPLGQKLEQALSHVKAQSLIGAEAEKRNLKHSSACWCHTRSKLARRRVTLDIACLFHEPLGAY
jgi:hypothetical protein